MLVRVKVRISGLLEFLSERETVLVSFTMINGSMEVYPLYTITDPLYARFKCTEHIGKSSRPEFSSGIKGCPLRICG